MYFYKFCIWMANYRAKEGISKAKMAEKCGISERYYAKIEKREEINPLFHTVRKMCRATDLCLDTLDSWIEEEEKKKDE